MATKKEMQGGLEWRVTIPEGSSAKIEYECNWIHNTWNYMVDMVKIVLCKVYKFMNNAWKMGIDDPRKIIHALKVGLALSLVSVFYYTRPLYEGVGGSAMWAIMTVVVVFEFTVGGCLYKGLNRAIATFSAGTLAVGIHWIASKSGHKVEPVILSGSVFILAAAATFSRFIPTIKARFDYGITIFILTFSLVAVSGYRVDELLDLAQQRLSTVAIGISICLFVCICICPVWSGQELHLLICRNLEKLADSIEGNVEEYFMKVDIDVKKESSNSTRSEGYKTVLNCKASEDSCANLAKWEPGHGRFGFRHPWNQYIKVASAIRASAYCIEALNSCINSGIEAPEYMKKHLSDACMRVSTESSKVLKELSNSIKSMKKSTNIDIFVSDMNNAVMELQDALKSIPNNFSRKTLAEQIGIELSSSFVEAMPLITAVSLLIEIADRIEGVVDAVSDLAKLACFKGVNDHNKQSSISPAPQQNDDQQALQQVI